MKFNIGLTELIALISLVIAIVGAVLGIVNTVYRFSKDRVKLRVSPVFRVPFALNGNVVDINATLHIEVTNLSAFPVTIVSVGFKLPKHKKGAIFSIQGNLPLPLPQRLEPRAHMSIPITQGPFTDSVWSEVEGVFADTACGETRYGTSKAFKTRINQIKKHTMRNNNKPS